jgi:HEAT repeat protein
VDSKDAWQQLLALSDAPDGLDEAVAETLVHLLHQRGEPVVLEWALPALDDPRPGRRQVAAWVLGQLGYEQGRPFADQVMPALAAAARSEQDNDTRHGLVAALGQADDPAWVPELLKYADDGYPAVRESVAGALPIMFAGDDMSADSVKALITLTRDGDPDVRDWATFSLGNQGRADSDAIRDALAARLDDEEGDTRFEATVGLARRRGRTRRPGVAAGFGTAPDHVDWRRRCALGRGELCDHSL